MSDAVFHILTTQGPVAIQRITEEDSAVGSVICLDGLAHILPISPAYDQFVRRPVGVIERMTGHNAYRLDVAARIDEGRSWQLAAYLAHAAHHQGGDNNVTVFATGEVDSTLAIRPVEQVDQKLKALDGYLKTHDVDPEEAVIIVPQPASGLPEQIGGIPVRKVLAVGEALQFAGIEMPADDPQPAQLRKANESRRHSTRAVLIGAVVLAAALFWAGGDMARWAALAEKGRMHELEEELELADGGVIDGLRADGYRKWLQFTKPGEVDIAFDGALYTTGDAAGCTDETSWRKRSLSAVYDEKDTVCRIEIRAVGNDRTVMIGRLGYWPDGLGNSDRPLRVMRGSAETAGRTWTLDFQRSPGPGAAVRLAVITGGVDIQGSQPWYRDLLAAPTDSPVFDAARQRLEALGFDVMALDWRRE